MRKIWFWVVLTAIAFSVTAIPAANALGRTSSPEAEENAAVVSEVSDTTPLYIMRELSGIIAIYYFDDDIPFCLLQANVDALPESDRKLLKTGILINSDEELKRLTEDYNS